MTVTSSKRAANPAELSKFDVPISVDTAGTYREQRLFLAARTESSIRLMGGELSHTGKVISTFPVAWCYPELAELPELPIVNFIPHNYGTWLAGPYANNHARAAEPHHWREDGRPWPQRR